MPAFQGKRIPVTERPQISGKSRSYLCNWQRKSELTRKDMYVLYPDMHRTERISISHSAGETIISHSGTGTFEDFSSKVIITDNKTIKFDTPSLKEATDKKLFVFSRAASAVLGYWRIAVRPDIPVWQDPAVVSAVSLVIGEKKAEEAFDLEVSGIDLGDLSFAEEKNGYLQNVNRSVTSRCTLNKRWAKEDCVKNAVGWVLYDKETGIVIEQDLIFTLLTGEGMASVVSATWRDKSVCQRTSD